MPGHIVKMKSWNIVVVWFASLWAVTFGVTLDAEKRRRSSSVWSSTYVTAKEESAESASYLENQKVLAI